jgi:hypothetical protein
LLKRAQRANQRIIKSAEQNDQHVHFAERDVPMLRRNMIAPILIERLNLADDPWHIHIGFSDLGPFGSRHGA